MLDAAFSFMTSNGPAQFAGAFFWGVLSVILSPCGIAAVPLVVGYIENTEDPTRWEAFKISCAFCTGIVLNLLLVGLVTSSFGLIFGGNEQYLTLLVAAVFILMGLHLTGLVHLRFFSLGGGGPQKERRGLRGALALGVLSGLALGPCSIAYVSPVLSLAAATSHGLSWAVGLVLSYALGYSAVLVLSGTFAQLASGWLQSEKGQLALKVLNFVCGAALIAVGIYLAHSVLFFMF